MSKVMVSIESPFVVSCLTSVVSNIVSLVVFEIFDGVRCRCIDSMVISMVYVVGV